MDYRRATTFLLSIAAVDFVGFALCRGAMRTSEYRREHRARGVGLANRDVEHVFPHGLGGANRPANYEVLSSHANRSLGNGLAANFDAVPMELLHASLSARSCGCSARTPPMPSDGKIAELVRQR